MPQTKTEPSAAQRPRRVTLQDIASIAGVHVMTVSDALNGTRSVAPATREKVQRIAKELNYVPNLAARALVTGRTKTIAILSGPLNEAYYANMAHFLEMQLTDHGYKMMFLGTEREVKDLVNATNSSPIDGAIANTKYTLVQEFLGSSVQPVQPCVFIGTSAPSFVDHVMVDLGPAVEASLQIMLSQGRRRIAYLVNNDDMVAATKDDAATETRMKTYLSVMEAAGLAPEIINTHAGDLNGHASKLRVQTRLKGHIESHGCPDGLLCQNDETASSAYRALLDLGRCIPDDVLLVGCDGLTYMEHFETPISTIVQPMEEMCAMAWQFLEQRMAHPEGPLQQAVVLAQLRIRPSLGTGAPPSTLETPQDHSLIS